MTAKKAVCSSMWLLVLVAPVFISSCGGGEGLGASGGCSSFTYAFDWNKTALGRETITYAVFYEGDTHDRRYTSEPLTLSITTADGTEINLPIGRDRQFWVSKDGKVSVFKPGLTVDELNQLMKLSDKTLESITTPADLRKAVKTGG